MLKIITPEEAAEMLGLETLFLDRGRMTLHWTDYEDTSFVCAMLQSRQRILEIGTFYGHTTENIARFNPSAEIYTVNVTKEMNIKMKLGCQDGELLSEIESGKMIQSPNITKIISTSDEYLEGTGLIFDGIFVDGDHSKEQVRKDSENSLNKLKEGGVLVWHDVYNKDAARCPKTGCEPEWNDVREYLEEAPFQVYKIGCSWIGFHVKGS